MNQKELDEYLKTNLSIDINRCGGDYGSKSFLEIQLKLKGEVISSTYIDD